MALMKTKAIEPPKTWRDAKARGSGVVLGKFMPPHLGHKHLVDFARHYVDDLTVMVGSLKAEPIPGELRFDWMRQLFPDVRVVHHTDENPQYPEEHPDFWEIWQRTMLARLPSPPDYLFASEDYGWKLAQVLGAKFIPVDISRILVPTSGTAIRQNPWAQWDYLPDLVRPYFVGRVCIFGPESTGKSTLTEALAKHFQTCYVPEYARTHIEAHSGELRFEDMSMIARGHAAAEASLATQANKLLFVDTDLLATTLWSDVLFGACDPWIAHEAKQRRYDLTLLLDVDVPWVADQVRYLPEDRRGFFDRCRALLESHQRPYKIIRGSWDERFKQAVRAVEDLLAQGPPGR